MAGTWVKPQFRYNTNGNTLPVMETITVAAGAAEGDLLMRDTSVGTPQMKLFTGGTGAQVAGICDSSDTAAAEITKDTGATGPYLGKTRVVGGVQADLQGAGVMGGMGPTGDWTTAARGHYTPIRVGDVYEMSLYGVTGAAFSGGLPVYIQGATQAAVANTTSAVTGSIASGILIKVLSSNGATGAGDIKGRGLVLFTQVEGT